MKYVDEFRDPELITKAAEEVRRLADPHRHYRLMEVCGGHTHAIYRFGLKDVLPENIELIHGPGCPVCVLPMGRIDDALAIAANRLFPDRCHQTRENESTETRNVFCHRF
jgi:hydrogenase expression/formation protein HypD